MQTWKWIWLAGALSVPASGQTILFQEDFSSGLGAWTTTSLWHWAPIGDTCVQTSNPPPGSGSMARMGDSSCTFETAPYSPIYLTMQTPVFIPSYADQPMLVFDSYVDSELCNGWDFHSVEISSDNGVTWDYFTSDCGTDRAWHTVNQSLSDFQGQSVQVRFLFDAVDPVANSGLGWLVDNVRIEAGNCGATVYCTAAANSASATGAHIGYSGTSILHLNNFTLMLTDGPPGQFAHFFYGPFEDAVPVAEGTLCVGTDSTGFRRLQPAGQIAANGLLLRPIDFPSLTGSHTILSGTRWNFQCWYRDQVGGMSVSNFSDALAVTFCE